MIFTSFKTLPESMKIPPTILPESLNTESYQYVFDVLPFAKIYLNTVFVTVLTVLFQEIGRAHVLTPVTFRSRMPSSACKKKEFVRNHEPIVEPSHHRLVGQ